MPKLAGVDCGLNDRVLLVEDDVPTRGWLTELLRATPGVASVHACATVAEARDWLATRTPDVVLTDLGLPDGSGLEVIRLAARHPRCEVLVLSIFGDEAHVLAAIDAGATGYLVKDGSLDAIQDHLQCLRSGGSPLSPSIARTLIRRTRAPRDEVAPDVGEPLLSQRELDVLTGVGKGFSYQEVAQMLGMSTNTVRTHVRNLYRKLAVNSRAEALYEYNRRMVQTGRPPIR
ncbi:response regulator transcription factor [Calidifontimicrobium sp. SYSU G02091]|uniref:response regulator transcription factor n=1 Tax=Calidifontimicrobium sp. SYSU G02091 TaxID=2926421 RepID=UPI001F53ABEA|nr:response regulator transcription factor [Calidifontimicrobium sp. SYSU G02091]MCI1190852.1 response regulator transcription factor [Calidifontimicrobium sp. SYSU G02091]